MRKVTGIFLLVASAAWCAGAGPNRIRDGAAKALDLIQSTQKDWYTTMVDLLLKMGANPAARTKAGFLKVAAR
jgi:hypothetical protein